MNRSKVDLVVAVGVLLLSTAIAFNMSRSGATATESAIVGLGVAVLCYVIELRFLKLSDVSGHSLLSHYQNLEEKILGALNLALNSKKLSSELHSSIIKPTVEHFIETSVIEQDPFVEKLLIDACHSFGAEIRHSEQNGLKANHYLKTLYELTNRSERIRATSLLPPSLWLRDSSILSYLDHQKELIEKGSLRNCGRVFIFEEKFFEEKDWAEIKSEHKGISLKRIVPPSHKSKMLIDFVIFDEKCVLVSDVLRDVIIGNNIADVQQMETRWKECEPLVSAQYIYSRSVVNDYISQFDELMFAGNN